MLLDEDEWPTYGVGLVLITLKPCVPGAGGLCDLVGGKSSNLEK